MSSSFYSSSHIPGTYSSAQCSWDGRSTIHPRLDDESSIFAHYFRLFSHARRGPSAMTVAIARFVDGARLIAPVRLLFRGHLLFLLHDAVFLQQRRGVNGFRTHALAIAGLWGWAFASEGVMPGPLNKRPLKKRFRGTSGTRR